MDAVARRAEQAWRREGEPDSTDPAQLGFFQGERTAEQEELERSVVVTSGSTSDDAPIDLVIGKPVYIVPRARRTDPETSHEAAESMVEGAASQRAEILRVLRDDHELWMWSPSCGMTADELDEYIGWRATTAGRRLIELQRLGLVRRTTEKRPTRSGRAAFVWVAV